MLDGSRIPTTINLLPVFSLLAIMKLSLGPANSKAWLHFPLPNWDTLDLEILGNILYGFAHSLMKLNILRRVQSNYSVKTKPL